MGSRAVLNKESVLMSLWVVLMMNVSVMFKIIVRAYLQAEVSPHTAGAGVPRFWMLRKRRTVFELPRAQIPILLKLQCSP